MIIVSLFHPQKLHSLKVLFYITSLNFLSIKLHSYIMVKNYLISKCIHGVKLHELCYFWNLFNWIFINIYSVILLHMYTCTCKHTHLQECTHIRTMRTHTYTCIHTPTHPHIHTHMHTHTHIDTHKHAHNQV